MAPTVLPTMRQNPLESTAPRVELETISTVVAAEAGLGSSSA
jgi:hypothetical protein